MLLYPRRITHRAVDTAGAVARDPPVTDVRSAYYYGTLSAPRPGPGAGDADLLLLRNASVAPLPVLHWFTQDGRTAETVTGSLGSMYYEDGSGGGGGQFFDNVFVRRRGQTSLLWPKPKLRLSLPRNAPRILVAPDWAPLDGVGLSSMW
jgi:hypothetical protein